MQHTDNESSHSFVWFRSGDNSGNGRTYLSPADALPFRRTLAAAFGSPDLTPNNNRSEAR